MIRAIRHYVTDENPSAVIAQIKKLSFHAANMSQYTGGMVRLRSVTPEGEVILTRVNGIDHVLVKLIAGGYLIALIASENIKWYTTFDPVADDYSLDDELSADPPGDFEINDQYYLAEFFDLNRENCPAIIQNGTQNYVTVAPDNEKLAPVDKWDDWHWHSYLYDGTPDTMQESEYIWRPPAKIAMDIGSTHFSMVDYTAFRDHTIISRNIDQLKRGYFPYSQIVSFGSFDLTSAQTPGNPSALSFYGRNGYALDADGKIIIYLERINVAGVVQPVRPAEIFPVQFFWPFIPYLDEIKHFNILYYIKGDDIKLLPELDSLYSWQLSYFDNNKLPNNLSLFGDAATFSAVDFSTSTDTDEDPVRCLHAVAGYDTYDGYMCHTGTVHEVITATTAPYASSGVRYVPIGVSGNFKALYVKNTWTIAGTGPTSISTYHSVTVGNLPLVWLSIGQDWDTWPGAFGIYTFRNDNVTDRNSEETASNSISMTQELMFGTEVIDTGVSEMSYAMQYTTESHYVGSWELGFREGCQNVSIFYTTTEMNAGESQTLHVNNSSDEDTYTWIVEQNDNGDFSGSKTATGNSASYTATPNNDNCTNSGTIILRCNGDTVDTLTITILSGQPPVDATREYSYGTVINYPCQPSMWLNPETGYYEEIWLESCPQGYYVTGSCQEIATIKDCNSNIRSSSVWYTWYKDGPSNDPNFSCGALAATEDIRPQPPAGCCPISIRFKTASYANPVADAFNTDVIDMFDGVNVHLTAPGVDQTLGSPSYPEDLKTFGVVVDSSSNSYTMTVNGKTIAAGGSAYFVWSIDKGQWQ
jgi:hypothetical protein